jgi:Putative peptidoglycan-binding domain-containing protein
VTHFNNYRPSSFGWEASPNREHITPYSFRDIQFPNGVHTATVKWWDLLLTELNRHVTFKNGQCWGYDYRPIKGGSAISFHAFGLALDINAKENPFSPTGKVVPHAMPDVVGTIAKKYGAEYGGDWSKPKDFMHFECHLDPNELQRFVSAHAKTGPTTIAYGPFAHVGNGSRTVKLGSAGTDVQMVQRWLGVTPDGYFGPVTEAHVRAYQRMRGITVDGIVGPVTWRNILHG